jgi:hypothetical protein
MNLEEIKTEALKLQKECLQEDVKIMNRDLRADKLKLQVKGKFYDQTLKRIYDHLGELIDYISKNEISDIDANVTFDHLCEQFSEFKA